MQIFFFINLFIYLGPFFSIYLLLNVFFYYQFWSMYYILAE